jgi:hypothetical protein
VGDSSPEVFDQPFVAQKIHPMLPTGFGFFASGRARAAAAGFHQEDFVADLMTIQ